MSQVRLRDENIEQAVQGSQASTGTRDAFTFDFFRRLRVCVEDWTLPGNVEVSLNGHDCG